MFRPVASTFLGIGVLAALLARPASAQTREQPAAEKSDRKPAATQTAEAPPANTAALHEKFQETLNGVKFVGHFTITGQSTGDLKKEEYEIRSVSKLPQGDLWLFQARIKYGGYDVTVPLPLEVKWAATTPIITLDNVTIPSLGTFGARVVIHDGKYAGTWSHGEVGGHLFGTIEKLKQDPAPQPGDQ